MLCAPRLLLSIDYQLAFLKHIKITIHGLQKNFTFHVKWWTTVKVQFTFEVFLQFTNFLRSSVSSCVITHEAKR